MKDKREGDGAESARGVEDVQSRLASTDGSMAALKKAAASAAVATSSFKVERNQGGAGQT